MSALPAINKAPQRYTRLEATTSISMRKRYDPHTMNITTIYGKAGSGKSTRLAALIRESKDYIVLAPTNAAVENIYHIVCEGSTKEIKRDRFRTLYSFFRIDYENDTVFGIMED